MMKQWTTLLVFLFLSLSLSAQQEYGRDIFVSSKGDSLADDSSRIGEAR